MSLCPSPLLRICQHVFFYWQLPNLLLFFIKFYKESKNIDIHHNCIKIYSPAVMMWQLKWRKKLKIHVVWTFLTVSLCRWYRARHYPYIAAGSKSFLKKMKSIKATYWENISLKVLGVENCFRYIWVVRQFWKTKLYSGEKENMLKSKITNIYIHTYI